MSKHEHKECGHDLRYCNKCDVVYCLSCNKEWGGHKHNYYNVAHCGHDYDITKTDWYDRTIRKKD